MPIYLLSPVSIDDPNWRASTYKREVTIRAPNEDIARSAACLAFGIAVARTTRDAPISICPWRLQELATCVTIEDDEGINGGPVEIVDPPHNNDALAGVDLTVSN